MAKTPNNPRDWIVFLHFGWIIALTLALGALGGNWLDERNGTSPLFLLIGVFLALLISGCNLYRDIRRLEHREKEAKKESSGQGYP